MTNAIRKMAYVAVLSTENYLAGVLMLWQSMQKHGAKWPLVVAITPNISREATEILQKRGVILRKIEVFHVDDYFKDVNKELKPHWTNTFTKLSIFNMTEFDKVVYIDSDMVLAKNIDELFDRPHMAAASAGRSYPGNEHWSGINSGLMVIEPTAELVESFALSMKEMVGRADLIRDVVGFGDQDVLNYHFSDWPQGSCRLGEEYNIFSTYLDFYAKNSSIIFDQDIKVIHYAGGTKPWQRSALGHGKHIYKVCKARKWRELVAYVDYTLKMYRCVPGKFLVNFF